MTDRDLTPDAATHDTPYGASEARAPVSERDRKAAHVLDALIGTRFNSASDPQIVEWCEQAIARARAEEREACAAVLDAKEAACMDLAANEPEYAQRAWAGAAQWRSGALAIRARGEK